MKLPSEVLFKYCTEARAQVEEESLHFQCAGGGGLRLTGNEGQYRTRD